MDYFKFLKYKHLSFFLKCAAAIIIGVFFGVIAMTFWHGLSSFPVLNPKGLISTKEHTLMIFVATLLLSIAIPVVLSMFFIIWKYRATNKHAEYAPDTKPHFFFMILWWAIPGIVILFLSVLTWTSTHELDPRKPLMTQQKPLTIQVVALQWKWLFIYPEQHIASLNFVEFPKNTPITFELTADAPMNSFWIPQLGGQMYAMSGMVNKLHLMANEIGEFQGSDAEISGAGFAGMRFKAKSTTDEDFNKWINSIQHTQSQLDNTEYTKLAKPSENNPVTYYYPVQTDLYSAIINKYMKPSSNSSDMKDIMK